tara:strand:- start:162 stop:485 length:324 start_codon:yes stop_codon:yes gene_type:complete
MKIDRRKEDGLLLVTVTVPKYNRNNPGPNETSETIKIGYSRLVRNNPDLKQLKLIDNNTLDNRIQTQATWVFELAKPEPVKPVSEKPKTTTRRRKTRKTIKKTETEV